MATNAELMKERMDSTDRVVLGKYMKADKGVSFELLEDEEGLKFRFNQRDKVIAITEENTFEVESKDWDYAGSKFAIDLSLLPRIALKEIKEDGEYFDLVPGQVGTEQLHVFKDVGALVVHHAVPPSLLDKALESDPVKKIVKAAKEAAVQQPIPYYSDNYKKDDKDPEKDDDAVLALAKPLWPLVRAIVGEPELDPPGDAQVVVRCTARGEAAAAGEISRDVHIDGLHSRDSTIGENTVEPFTLLLGIPLQDCDGSTQRGNFSFVPGSHKAMARGASRKAKEASANFPSAQAAADCLKVPGQSETPYAAIQKFVDLDMLAAPVQVMCKAGGAFLAHYLTLHYGQPNTHGKAGVTVYFRVKVAENRRQWPQCLLKEHMFTEMPGLPSD